MKNASLLAALLLCIAVAAVGCLPAPRSGDGRVDLTVTWGASRAGARMLEDIATVTATLTRQSLTVSVSLVVDFAAGTATGAAEDLYPGEWTVQVDAVARDGTVIYTGQTTVMVVSGQTSQASLTLQPAPGSLDITMDISLLLDKGLEITGGKVGIYKDPASGSATYKDLTVQGTELHGLITGLASQTYEARVVIPQATNAIFTSEFFRFTIRPGRTAIVYLDNDGQASVAIGILPEPGQVTGLHVTFAGTERVDLAWDSVSGAEGYRVYRTDEDGRFVQREVLSGGGISSYSDTEFASAKPYNAQVRYAVAALANGLEGIRSDPVAVAK